VYGIGQMHSIERCDSHVRKIAQEWQLQKKRESQFSKNEPKKELKVKLAKFSS
jgi:hypothetical protein